MPAKPIHVLREPARLDRPSGILLVMMLAVAAYLALRVLLPGRVPLIFDCPFHQYLGLNCLGCGMTRAGVHTFAGRLGEAIRFNPLVVLVLPFVAYYAASLLAAGLLRRRLVSGWPTWFVQCYQWLFIASAAMVGLARLTCWVMPETRELMTQWLLVPPGG